MRIPIEWQKGIMGWVDGDSLCISVVFTWKLPEAKRLARKSIGAWGRVMVGGPAVDLMPEFFKDLPGVLAGGRYSGVMQRFNPLATATTEGCIWKCPFCAVPKLQPQFRELSEWPDLPVLVDNNLFAAKRAHFDRVIDRLKVHGWADFNQGVDARLLTEHHARRIAEIKRPRVRLALDSWDRTGQWDRAFDLLRSAGLSLRSLRSYVLIGFQDDPGEAWDRCQWVEKHKIKALPMWFHELNAMEHNIVTKDQGARGWTDYERRRIMAWFYQHRKAVP